MTGSPNIEFPTLFFWTRKEANGVAHSSAKAASSLRSPFFFSHCRNSSSLPGIFFGMPGSWMGFLFSFFESSFYKNKRVNLLGVFVLIKIE
jgi:hypothetical protein